MAANRAGQRFQKRGGRAHPIRQRRARQVYAFAPEDLALAIERQTIGVFVHQHMRQQARARTAPLDRTRRQGGLLERLAIPASAARANDAVYDKNGNLLFTDPPYGLNGGTDSIYRELNYTGIFSLKSTGELVLLDDSIQYPNGIGLSPSGDTLYIGSSDTVQPAWFAFDVKANGHLSNKRVFFDATSFKNDTNLEGYPDGMAVHSDGVLFASGPGGVWLFDDNGVVLARIYTGKATANCALSSDEKTLFITAHDVVLTIPIL